MSAILTVTDLGISFGSNHVLKNINFELGEGEVLGVIGPNGAGKTVMLNILTGILKPTKGTIVFQGQEISGQVITERCQAGIGRTFQVPRPFEQMTVFENIMVGGVFGANMSEAEAKKKAIEVSKIIKLDDKLDLFAGKLGLLDRKRLEIGRALATEPKILLLDEVGGGLTESEVGLIIDLVKTIKKQGVSVIWIEHIIRTMLEGTDRVMLVADGVDVITGVPLEVMNSDEVKRVYMGGGDDEE
ncbi:MAG: ATP-binding cassette domain-containing protein [Lachnospiraceae bacterium]|nr:ATP-binding cassette domain-containing protein [Lachnospiraceae bacterium]